MLVCLRLQPACNYRLRHHIALDMLLFDPKTARVLITVLLFAAVLGFAWAARATLIAFLFAIFFAYLVSPLVKQAQYRARISRGMAIAIIYFVISVALGLLLLSVGPKLVREAQKLSVTIPDLYARITTGQIASTVGSQHGWSQETIQKIQVLMAAHRDCCWLAFWVVSSCHMPN